MPGPSTMLSLTIPLRLSMLTQAVLDPVPLLGPLGVVPLVHSADKIAGDAPNTLKANALAQLFGCALNSHSNTSLFDALKCGHFGILSSQFFNALGIDLLALTAAAAGTNVANDAHITADGIPVNRVVDGAITDAMVVHTADNGLKGFHIVGGIDTAQMDDIA